MTENAVITPAAPAPDTAQYEAHRQRQADKQRAQSQATRDIGELPAVADPARRERCRLSFRTFVETYGPKKTFYLPFCDDHFKAFAVIDLVVLTGGLFGVAMPRGWGKTGFCEFACVWAMVYRHREFVAIVGPTDTHAQMNLESIASEFENNDLLMADFPEICYPLRKLDGISQRRLLYKGLPIRIQLTAHKLVLPDLTADKYAGPVICASSLTGNIRGMRHKADDGATLRPSLVMLDDPQKKEEASNPAQVKKLIQIIRSDVLPMGGAGRSVSAIMPCTVICKDDLADQILNREVSPEWQGIRTKMVHSFPTNTALWDEYANLLGDSQRANLGMTKATAFYKRNRRKMDAGAKVSWPERFDAGEISALQHAMNTRHNLKERGFMAECQNEPLDEFDFDGEQLTTKAIISRLSGVARGIVPLDTTRLTAFIDPKKRVLQWMVVAWGEGFTGSVIDYGCFPEQRLSYFLMRDVRRTLASAYPGAGLEGTVRAGLAELTGLLLGREWVDEDGAPRRIDRCLIDANWGDVTKTVYSFVRSSPHSAVLFPSHGRGITADMIPFSDYRRRPGERAGLNWRIGIRERRQRAVIFDTNFWKSQIRNRLQTAEGDPGALTVFGLPGKADHAMLADHWTSEYFTPTAGRHRRVDVWSMKRKDADNDWWDCIVGAAVAASIEGVTVAGEAPVARRERVSFAALQREARGGR